MQDIIALKHTLPNFKKQARVHNKEQVRTAVSFKATFFRRAFRFLLLPFRIKHMALPKGTLNSTLLIPPIFLGYCYICSLCIHCCCCPAVQAQRKFLYITHLWSAINSETNCHLNSVLREAESLILCSVTYWSRSIFKTSRNISLSTQDFTPNSELDFEPTEKEHSIRCIRNRYCFQEHEDLKFKESILAILKFLKCNFSIRMLFCILRSRSSSNFMTVDEWVQLEAITVALCYSISSQGSMETGLTKQQEKLIPYCNTGEHSCAHRHQIVA